MTTTEERLQVLKMIEEGKISADEGARLLKALGKAPESAEPLKGASKPRWFRVRITDTQSGSNKANVNIPMGLVNVGLRLGARFVPESADESLDMRKIAEIIESGRTGKVFDAVDEKGGERVEIFIE